MNNEINSSFLNNFQTTEAPSVPSSSPGLTLSRLLGNQLGPHLTPGALAGPGGQPPPLLPNFPAFPLTMNTPTSLSSTPPMPEYLTTLARQNPRPLSPQSVGSGQGKRANRTRFTDYQIKVLQEFFENNAYPKDDDLEYLSKLLGLSPRVIVVWFQNARQKARKIYENQPSSNFDMNEQKLVISGTKQEDTNPYFEIEMKQEYNELLQNFEKFIENNEILDIKDELRKEMSNTKKPVGVIHEEKMPLEYSKCLAKLSFNNAIKSDAVHEVKKPFDYKCSTCPAKFESHSAHKRHITCIKRKKSIECPVCHAKFCYTNDLHRHVVLVHEGKAQFYTQLLFKPRLI